MCTESEGIILTDDYYARELFSHAAHHLDDPLIEYEGYHN